MSSRDPLSDFMVMLKNGLKARKDHLLVPGSRLKVEIVKILQEEGFIRDYKVVQNEKQNSFSIKVMLKYFNNAPVLTDIRRVSRSSRRLYLSKDQVKKFRNGLGVFILTTSRGLMTDFKARKLGIGGEVICSVY